MATDKLRTLASRTLGLWRVVKLFRDVGHRGIPATVDHVRTQTTRIIETLDHATRSLSEINQPGYAEKVLAETTRAAADAAESAIEKTSLVLGHSILDEVLTECCRISAALMPDRWIILLEDRQITLKYALSTPAQKISEQLLTRYLEQVGFKSLTTRIDLLNERYQPAPPFEYDRQAYRLDRARLEEIDTRRQRVIHKVDLTRAPQDQGADDLLYLEATCFFFIDVVAKKHGIAVDPFGEEIENLRAKPGAPVQLAYEGLLLATSLPTADEQLWSAGGQIFAARKRRSRQLPLLMPAATPALSGDRRKLVFVKYRAKAEPPEYEDQRNYVGDIWISNVDGSDAELVLEGGPRPGLVTPVPGFAEELEGVSSPQFDPSGRQIYFIADAWATSGAIYALDLQSREARYVTPGNSLTVLHGGPYSGSLLVNQHRYYGPPDYGSYDDFWLVAPSGEVGQNLGPDFEAALGKLYGADARRTAFPQFA